MSTLAEIEIAVKTLPLADQEALFRFLIEQIEVTTAPASPYQIKAHPGNVRPGIDPDKLGQFTEDGCFM